MTVAFSHRLQPSIDFILAIASQIFRNNSQIAAKAEIVTSS
ncbi:hypothetical protein [Nostoc sp. ChiQUE01b]|nr:hypothetical protein [Nostoc sp. ChiQUE01b]